MLFFELFAPFMAVLSIVVAIRLYVMERRARQEPEEPPRPTAVRHAGAADREGPERVRRPSMLP